MTHMRGSYWSSTAHHDAAQSEDVLRSCSRRSIIQPAVAVLVLRADRGPREVGTPGQPPGGDAVHAMRALGAQERGGDRGLSPNRNRGSGQGQDASRQAQGRRAWLARAAANRAPAPSTREAHALVRSRVLSGPEFVAHAITSEGSISRAPRPGGWWALDRSCRSVRCGCWFVGAVRVVRRWWRCGW